MTTVSSATGSTPSTFSHIDTKHSFSKSSESAAALATTSTIAAVATATQGGSAGSAAGLPLPSTALSAASPAVDLSGLSQSKLVKHLKGQIEAIKQLPHPVLAKYSLPTNFEKLSKARLCEIIQRLLADSKPPVPELAKTMAELYDTVVIKPLGWDLIAALPVVSVESLGLPSERGRYYPSISPDKMRFPAARGQDSEGLGFIAVRCVSLENPKDLVVACVYRRFAIAELSWNYRGGSLLQQGSNVQDSDFLKLKNLLLGNTILADDRAPSFRYKMV